MRIEVDKDKCILCGVCESLCPTVFHQDTVLHINNPGIVTEEDRARLAVDVCPMSCLDFIEE